MSSYLLSLARERRALRRHPGLRVAAVPPLQHLHPHRPRHQRPGRPQGQDHRPAGIPDDRQCLGARHAGGGVRRPAARHQMAARRPGRAGPRGARQDQPAAGDRPASGAARPHASPTCWRRARSTALLSARAPTCFLRGAPNVGRLWPDYPAVEEAYYKKTKLFPIMHGIGIRRSLVEKYPWLAVNIYKAFVKAKALCMEELGQIGHLATRPCRGRSMPTTRRAR